MSLKAAKPATEAYPKELKTLGDHLRKRRLDLKLFQKGVARKLGTSKGSLINWENNLASPSLPFLPRIVDFLGYVPYDSIPQALSEKIVFIRSCLGLSQEKLARKLGLDPTTLARWEHGKSTPSFNLWERFRRFLRELPIPRNPD